MITFALMLTIFLANPLKASPNPNTGLGLCDMYPEKCEIKFTVEVSR